MSHAIAKRGTRPAYENAPERERGDMVQWLAERQRVWEQPRVSLLARVLGRTN